MTDGLPTKSTPNSNEVAMEDQSLSELVFAVRNNSQPDGEQASEGKDTGPAYQFTSM